MGRGWTGHQASPRLTPVLLLGLDFTTSRLARREQEESWLLAQPWSTLILRPAAIYGPGRGIHVRIRDGKPPRTAESTMISRIHVEDLAGIVEASLYSEIEGCWPCADHEPCT